MSMFFKVRCVGHYSVDPSNDWDDGLMIIGGPVYISPREIEEQNKNSKDYPGCYRVSTDRATCHDVQQSYVREHRGWRSVELIVKAMGISSANEKAREFADALYPPKGC